MPIILDGSDAIGDLGDVLAGKVSSATVTTIVSLTQAEYDALTPDAATLYVITD